MYYLTVILGLLLMLTVLAFSMAMLLYPKQLGRWWSKNMIMRFRKLWGVDKSWVEAQNKFWEEDHLASGSLGLMRIMGFVFMLLSIIAISILMLILLGSILDVFK